MAPLGPNVALLLFRMRERERERERELRGEVLYKREDEMKLIIKKK